MFLLLCTAVLAGGASSSLAPDLNLASRCLIILIGPAIVSTFLLEDRRYLGLAGAGWNLPGFSAGADQEQLARVLGGRRAAERERMLGSAERKRAETERASLVAAVEQTAEEIVITDAEGNIQYCNPSFERLDGILAERSDWAESAVPEVRRAGRPVLSRPVDHDCQRRNLDRSVLPTARKTASLYHGRRHDFADSRRRRKSYRFCFGNPRRDRPPAHGRSVAARAKNGRDRPPGGRRRARFQ